MTPRKLLLLLLRSALLVLIVSLAVKKKTGQCVLLYRSFVAKCGTTEFYFFTFFLSELTST